ncbi:AraC family transcriptional regulator [Nonomuraea sp. NPDC049158]|uniref:helix-turn-helix domain-containing protein n=1 Tax=Nonomuraea sp. NPDC049158 TaxID=3155649 RepID=UPI0033E8F8DB
MAQVAHACGFASHASFATAYRHEFGVTPSETRGDRFRGNSRGWRSGSLSLRRTALAPERIERLEAQRANTQTAWKRRAAPNEVERLSVIDALTGRHAVFVA